MKTTSKPLLHWTPRLLAVLFILFISMFALDIFAEDYTWWETIVGLFMHLIPSFILLAVLISAWRWPGIGGLLFLAISIGFVFAFNLLRDLISALLIAGPPLLIGVLFLWDWQVQRSRMTSAA